VVAARGATLAELITGGEDYEVLAAIAPHEVEKFKAAAAAAGTPVTRIGFIVDGGQGLRVHDGSGRAMAFTRTGWDHFGD
jgi:thiamine-monophosphate kinase